MRYFKLTIAYDGTDFHGWQIQTNKPTVQGEIVSVLRRLTQENVHLHGSGRTDAGVHALGQVASFHTQSPLAACEFQRALNALLPATIRIVAAEDESHIQRSRRQRTIALAGDDRIRNVDHAPLHLFAHRPIAPPV